MAEFLLKFVSVLLLIGWESNEVRQSFSKIMSASASSSSSPLSPSAMLLLQQQNVVTESSLKFIHYIHFPAISRFSQ